MARKTKTATVIATSTRMVDGREFTVTHLEGEYIPTAIRKGHPYRVIGSTASAATKSGNFENKRPRRGNGTATADAFRRAIASK